MRSTCVCQSESKPMVSPENVLREKRELYARGDSCRSQCSQSWDDAIAATPNMISEVLEHALGYMSPSDSNAMPIEDRFLVHVGVTETGKKIHWYNFKKLVKYSAVTMMFTTGTIYRMTNDIWFQMSGYFAVFIVAVLTAFAIDIGGDSEESGLDDLVDISENIQMLCPFLFGMFVSTTLKRWWSIRTDAIGKCADHLVNLSGMVASLGVRILHADADWSVFLENHERLVNYGLASMSFAAIESGEGVDIDHPVRMGYLTSEEFECLRDCSDRSHAATIWCWIGAVASELLEMCKVPPPNFNVMLQEVRMGVAGIHTLHHYVRTPLPFPYIHLITFLVNLHNFLMAFVAGFRFTAAWAKGHTIVQVFDVFQFLVVPILYQSILLVCVEIMDPMGRDIIDFPVRLMQLETASACFEQTRTTRRMYDELRAAKQSPLPNAHTIWKLPPPPKKPQLHPGSVTEARTPAPDVTLHTHTSEESDADLADRLEEVLDRASTKICDKVVLGIMPLVNAMEEDETDCFDTLEDPFLASYLPPVVPFANHCDSLSSIPELDIKRKRA